MQSQNRFFDDIARVASGAASAITGVRDELETRFRDQLERVLAGMDLVSREEFEAVKAMAAKARDEQESAQQRVTELEARLAALEQQSPQKP
jgi:BMFP domain-containing protein YqiC